MAKSTADKLQQKVASAGRRAKEAAANAKAKVRDVKAAAKAALADQDMRARISTGVGCGGQYVTATGAAMVARVDPGNDPDKKKSGWSKVINYGASAAGVIGGLAMGGNIGNGIAVAMNGPGVAQRSIDAFVNGVTKWDKDRATVTVVRHKKKK